MDIHEHHANEIIADSEDEESHTIPKPMIPDPATSLIQTPAPPSGADTATPLAIGADISNISISTDNTNNPGPSITTFTNIAADKNASSSINTAASASIPTGRPKPRPLFNKEKRPITSSNDPIENATKSTSTLPFDIPIDTFVTSSIADRAKMRSRNPKPTADSITASSAKSRERPRPSTDVIELLSDEEDELVLRPTGKSSSVKAKTRPKPKPKTKANHLPDLGGKAPPLGVNSGSQSLTNSSKRTKTSHATLLPTHPDPTSQASLPVPTSPLTSDQHQNPFVLLSSQLPPSDPPPTSTATQYDHPPIVTLPNPETDLDVPSSSPSSLFSVSESGKGKRKRGASLNHDELDSDHDIPARGLGIMKPPPTHLQPPPTFFAGASSSSFERPPPPPAPEVEVIDLSNIPPTAIVVPDAEPTKKPVKPRKPRKKKGEVQEEGAETSVAANKPKAKGKVTKSPVRNQVEVVIGVSATKAKAKPRAPAKTKEKDKETFKSREIIDDEDEAVVEAGTSVRLGASLGKPDSMTSLSSVPDSEGEGDDTFMAGSKRKSAVGGRDSLRRAESPKKKLKEKVARDEDGDEGDVIAKQKPPAKGKAKMVILSEDDEEEAVIVPSRAKKTAKPAKKSVDNEKVGRGGRVKKGKKDGPDPVDEPIVENKTDGWVENDETETRDITKENVRPAESPHAEAKPADARYDTPSQSLFPSLSSRYTIASKVKTLPMSELIRRVNSMPGSPFSTPHPRASSSAQKRPSTPGTTYSPYLKSSRSFLSRIAPLHPNRRTPPPPPPPPPPPKKTKKEKEREEKWEEELVESVGGINEWACMTDAERKELRKVKWEREMGGWEE